MTTKKKQGALRAAPSAARLSREQQAGIFCIKNGHSRLMDAFFGYHHCCRCEAQLGDSLGGVYRNDSAVYVGHMHVLAHGTPEQRERLKGCPCAENAKKLTKKDFAHVPQWGPMGNEQRPPWRKRDIFAEVKPRAAPPGKPSEKKP